jgi:HK97 family phage major capsid protein/HK97 family phage prohead protease
MDRAYSLLEIKAVDEDAREIEGWATTPAPDRVGDIVEPLGAKFSNPLPLLWMHRHEAPVGEATFGKPTAKGIPFKARIAKIAEPGILKDRVDEAWQSLKAKLVRAVSIGFRSLEHSYMDTGGIRFSATEILELSLVTVPANAEATITAIKAIDTVQRAASGHDAGRVVRLDGHRPGVSGNTTNPPKREEPNMSNKTLQEQIAAFEAKRAANVARMGEIMEKSAEKGETLDEALAEEHDGLSADVSAIDKHIGRLKASESLMVSKAAVVDKAPANGGQSGVEVKGSLHSKITVSKNLPKGTGFTRYVMAMANARGSISDALKHAERWTDTPEVAEYIKAAAGTTTGANWAAPLVDPGNLAGEFLELLMPETVLGKISNFRRVPFNTQIPIQTGGATVNWVGEAAAKPVTENTFDTVALGINKVAGIIVLTDELVRLSTPNAEQLVRNDLIRQISKFLDEQFLDPGVSATGSNPASVTNTAASITATGTDADAFRADLRALRALFYQANMSTAGSVLVIDSVTADALADMVNPLGQSEFPNLSVTGGSIRGMEVVVSNNSPADSSGSNLTLMKASEILMADDGVTLIDASREATLDMNGGNTPAFSLWQKNCVGVRAERWITWLKARANAVAYITGANYGQ